MKKHSFTSALRLAIPFGIVMGVCLAIPSARVSAQSLTSVWEVIDTKGTGHSVAQAGDINGDGYMDMLTGNPYYSNGHTYEGKITVFYGTASGFATTGTWSAEGGRDSAHLGWSVAGMCDINHDGYTDVIAGAPGTVNVGGKVHIYYGSSTGLPSSPSITITESQAGERFGYAITTADTDHDGYSEVFIGAPYNNGGSSASGKVYMYGGGSSSGFSSSPLSSMSGTGQNSGFGWSIAIGNVTATGTGTGTNKKYNLIVGAPGTGNNETASVTVTDVLPDEKNVPPTQKLVLSGNGKFGYSVAIAGDINKDGYEDILAGAPGYTNGHNEEGRAALYYGGANPSQTAAWSVESNEANAKLGTAVAGRGRVNSDTLDDIAIASPGSAINCLSVYPGTGAGLSSVKYLLLNLPDEFSSVTFTKNAGSATGGIIAGATAITRGYDIGKAKTKYIREFDDILNREGIAQMSAASQDEPILTAYPNPASRYVMIEIASTLKPETSGVEIINGLGVVVHSTEAMPVAANGNMQTLHIDLPVLPEGMYYAVVRIGGRTIFKTIQINN